MEPTAGPFPVAVRGIGRAGIWTITGTRPAAGMQERPDNAEFSRIAEVLASFSTPRSPQSGNSPRCCDDPVTRGGAGGAYVTGATDGTQPAGDGTQPTAGAAQPAADGTNRRWAGAQPAAGGLRDTAGINGT